MSVWDILMHPWRAQAEMERLRGYEAAAFRLNDELEWLAHGPGVKKVEGGWIVRHYPLHREKVHKTLRSACQAGMAEE